MAGGALLAPVLAVIYQQTCYMQPVPPVAAAPPAEQLDSEAKPTAKYPLPPGVESDPGAYFRALDSLDGRFLEYEEFVASMAGRRVTWRGWVLRVSQGAQDEDVRLMLGETEGRGSLNSWYATFPASWRTKLYTLEPGDHVEIVGTLHDLISLPIYPGVNGEGLTVIQPAH